MPRKAKSIARLTNDAAEILQRIVRIKASDSNGYCSCVTCGRRQHYKDMDGGHFISRAHNSHRLLEDNIHPQCKKCNGYLKGNLVAYTLFMIQTYGEDFVRELQDTKLQVKKYSRAEIMGIIEDFKHYETVVREQKGLT